MTTLGSVRRLILDAFCSTLGLWTVIPARVQGPFGVPFGEHSVFIRCIRIPVGGSSCNTLPSLLDYLSVGRDMTIDSWIDWSVPSSDNAMMFASIMGNHQQRRSLRERWRCNDWFACFE